MRTGGNTSATEIYEAWQWPNGWIIQLSAQPYKLRTNVGNVALPSTALKKVFEESHMSLKCICAFTWCHRTLLFSFNIKKDHTTAAHTVRYWGNMKELQLMSMIKTTPLHPPKNLIAWMQKQVLLKCRTVGAVLSETSVFYALQCFTYLFPHHALLSVCVCVCFLDRVQAL